MAVLLSHPVNALVEELGEDRASILQLMLSLCNRETLSRIHKCPTFPIRIVTPDLSERVTLLKEAIRQDPDGPSNVLAQIFERVVEQGRRKSLGLFFTPPNIADYVINRVSPKPGEMIVDAGCGTGQFGQAMLKKLGIDKAGKVVYLGFEVEPLLALASALSLDLMKAPPDWKIFYGNYLLTEKQDLARLGYAVDAIVSNPPFVRFHRISRRMYLKTLMQKRTGNNVSGLSGLHMLFLLHSSTIIRESGRIAFLFPSEVRGADYESGPERSLSKRFDIDKINLSTVFPEGGNGGRIAWLYELSPRSSKSAIRDFPSSDSMISSPLLLSSFFSVHRGISTGSNSFFVLTEDKAKELSVPKEFLRKIIPTKTRFSSSEIFSEADWRALKQMGKACWLLTIPPDTAVRNLPSGLRRYIKLGERNGIHLSPTARARSKWYCVKPSNPPNYVFTYMSRGSPRFIINEAKASILTNLLGIYAHHNSNSVMDKEEHVLSLLNQSVDNWMKKSGAGRHYAGGLLKFEPGYLSRMPLLESVLQSLKLRPNESLVQYLGK